MIVNPQSGAQAQEIHDSAEIVLSSANIKAYINFLTLYGEITTLILERIDICFALDTKDRDLKRAGLVLLKYLTEKTNTVIKLEKYDLYDKVISFKAFSQIDIKWNGLMVKEHIGEKSHD